MEKAYVPVPLSVPVVSRSHEPEQFLLLKHNVKFFSQNILQLLEVIALWKLQSFLSTPPMRSMRCFFPKQVVDMLFSPLSDFHTKEVSFDSDGL